MTLEYVLCAESPKEYSLASARAERCSIQIHYSATANTMLVFAEPLSQPQTRAPGVSGHMSVRSYAITGLEAAELRHQEASVSTPRPTAASIGPTSPHTHRASERNIDLRQAEEPLEANHLQAEVVRTIEAAGAQPPGRKPADPPASPVLQIHASDDLTNSKVVDRLVAFSVGQMGVEALLQGNVIGAIKFLLEAQQRGVTVVADTLRRAVTLAVGSASPSSSTATAAAVQKVLSDLIGVTSGRIMHWSQCHLSARLHRLAYVQPPAAPGDVAAAKRDGPQQHWASEMNTVTSVFSVHECKVAAPTNR